jgi:hypothetical protein
MKKTISDEKRGMFSKLEDLYFTDGVALLSSLHDHMQERK